MPGPAYKEMYPLYRSERIWGAQWPEIGHSPPPPPLTSQIGKSTFAFSEQRNCREKSKIQDLKIVDNRNPLLPVWTCGSFMGGSTFSFRKRSITIRHSKGDLATSFRFFYADHQRFLFRKWLSGRILVDFCDSDEQKLFFAKCQKHGNSPIQSKPHSSLLSKQKKIQCLAKSLCCIFNHRCHLEQ